jgi:hypothetical protein
VLPEEEHPSTVQAAALPRLAQQRLAKQWLAQPGLT